MSFYPQINDAMLAQFQVVFANMVTEASYLDKAPWSDDVKDFFRKYGERGSTGGETIFVEGIDKIDNIEEQIGFLLADLNRMGEQLKSTDHAERLSYLKTKAALIEKLVVMRERVFNVKEMSEFQGVVMAFLEEICTKDQVTTLMKRLGHMGSIQEKQ